MQCPPLTAQAANWLVPMLVLISATAAHTKQGHGQLLACQLTIDQFKSVLGILVWSIRQVIKAHIQSPPGQPNNNQCKLSLSKQSKTQVRANKSKPL
jgi:hypothetical protein